MRSDSPRSCEGPKVYRFCGGAFTWQGCPRLALGPREDEWIKVWDRCDGKLSATESSRLPMLLVEAFDVLEEGRAQRLQHELAKAK